MAIRILFLSANPSDTQRLQVIEEFNDIDAKLRASANRDKFDLVQRHAISVDGLTEILLRYEPRIVHFSGHGSQVGGLIFQGPDGNPEQVPPPALTHLFKILAENIRCVFLNACYSENQAQAISQNIDCVIGMSKAITDLAARKFAVAFYQALGFGRNIQEAFDLANVQLELFRIPEQDTPTIKYRPGMDPARIFIDEKVGRKKEEPPIEWVELYKNLQTSMDHLRLGRISIREFWEVDGKGNLYQALMFFRTHADDYQLGDMDKQRIDSLLTRIPVSLSQLQRANLGFAEHSRKQLEIEIYNYYTEAMDLLQRLSRTSRE
jgi:hypothetical protein